MCFCCCLRADWQNEVDELLVRTCVAHILAVQHGAARGQEEITAQATHYRQAPELYALLNQYTAHRKRYPSLEAFYPEIIAFLEKKAS
ncbi:DUF4932 domain-containing protein [Hymenobacter sediminis]|uniref:DUF4932 domain-containing protein n=1 Tax=Hymenobacter sediminis TaxID=2218621 RepID=UPI0034DACA42